jgi:formate-dependent nitrite reductase membrane component NrfD
MSHDQILVIGIVICALAIPSLLAAYSESRPPRAGAIMVLIGGVLLTYALTQKSGGYRFDQIPHIFVQVIADLIR